MSEQHRSRMFLCFSPLCANSSDLIPLFLSLSLASRVRPVSLTNSFPSSLLSFCTFARSVFPLFKERCIAGWATSRLAPSRRS